MAKFEHFDFLGPVYDKIFGRGSVDALLTHTRLESKNIVLDLGGGTGRVSAAIMPHVQVVHVGDCALGMLRMAQSRGLDSLMTCSEYLPYPNRSFDRIIMVDAFHHLADQAMTIKEMWRVLKPGGLIVIEEPDIADFWVKLIAFGEKVLLMRSHFKEPEKIAQMGKVDNDARVSIKKSSGIAWVIISKLTHERGDIDGRDER